MFQYLSRTNISGKHDSRFEAKKNLMSAPSLPKTQGFEYGCVLASPQDVSPWPSFGLMLLPVSTIDANAQFDDYRRPRVPFIAISRSGKVDGRA